MPILTLKKPQDAPMQGMWAWHAQVSGCGLQWQTNVGGGSKSSRTVKSTPTCSYCASISADFIQEQYPIRLVDGGGSANSGRLQVLYNGTWGTVCDHFFGTNEVAVVCRQLGFNNSGQLARRGEFRPSTDSEPIWLDEVQCHGNEGHLDECDFPGWGYHEHCTHFEDVGVHCAGKSEDMVCVHMCCDKILCTHFTAFGC